MKRFFTPAIAVTALALICIGCAEDPESGANDLNLKFFNAWINQNYKNAQQTPLGAYIIEDHAGSGKTVGDYETSPYLYVSYYATDLDGNYALYSDESLAKQLGTYQSCNYYGKKIWDRRETYGTYGLYAGLDDAIETMKVGGSRKAVIPGWLITNERYKNPQDYIDNVTGTDVIYSVTVHDAIQDIVKWEVDSLDAYVKHTMPGLDSTEFGYYYKQLVPPTDTTTFEDESTVYINYTGRLLNGQVFDSTIADTCKIHNIFVTGKSYAETSFTWNPKTDESKESSSNSSSFIKGFQKCLDSMRTGERGICIFYSGLGYAGKDTDKIPPYSPLIFEIEMIGKK